MNAFPLFLTSLLILSTYCHAAYLRIMQANVPVSKMKTGPMLDGRTVICSSHIFPKFTVECVPDKPRKGTATVAKFTWDNNFHMDTRPPFLMTPKIDNIAKPWLHRKEHFKLECNLDNSEKAIADVYFDCGHLKTTAKVLPVEAPSRQLANDTACVRIPAMNFTEKEGLWERNGLAMAYKWGEDSKKTDRPESSVLKYKFVAPVTSRYGLTLDWETSGGTDYNDVFVHFPGGGWQLKRKGKSRDVNGWIKAYQNVNGRATKAFSVDFKQHTITTRNTLTKGETYEFWMAGRSSKVRVFTVIFFPCQDEGCFKGHEWSMAVEACSQ